MHLTAQEYSDRLFDGYGVDLELADGSTALAILTPANTKEDIERLVQAAAEMAASAMKRGRTADNLINISEKTKNIEQKTVHAMESMLPPMAITPRDAWFSAKDIIDWKDAIGCIAGEAIIPYPPGIPLLCPGEVITREIWREIDKLRKEHRHMHGVQDPILSTILIVKQ